MKEDKQSKCYHCGGALTASEEMVACLMCGRTIGHKCELCINLPGQNTAVDSKHKTTKKVRRKKSTVSR